jgi:hypothetical protein
MAIAAAAGQISGAACRTQQDRKAPFIVYKSSLDDSVSAGHLDMMASLRMGLDKDLGRSSSLKTEAHIPPLLGVAPLGPVPLSKDHQFQYRYKTFA